MGAGRPCASGHGCEARGERGWVVRLTGEVCGGVGVCPTSKRFSRVGMSTAVMSTSCLQRVPVWSLRKRSMMGTSLGSTYTIGSPCVTTPVVMTLGSIDLMLCRICCAGVNAGGFAAGCVAVVQRARRTTGIERMTPVLPKRLPQGGARGGARALTKAQREWPKRHLSMAQRSLDGYHPPHSQPRALRHTTVLSNIMFL